MAASWHVWHRRVRVAPARVGQGVFALRPFRAGQAIGLIQGIVSRDPHYGSEYCMDLGGNCSLEPIPPYRYLNHSCDPNAEIIGLEYGRPGENRADQLLLVAVREIATGDEITIDYAWSAENSIRCLCGSPNCRGWVVDAAELASFT